MTRYKGTKIINIGFEKLQKEEVNKRFYFGFKALLLAGLIFIQLKYPNFLQEYLITADLSKAILFLLTYLLVIGMGRLSLVYFYLKKHKRTNEFKDNFVLGINKIASLLSTVGYFLAILAFLDIEVSKFFTSISIVAAAIAILSKDYISNMINGMILMFSNQLSLNDNVKIGNHTGRIADITLLNIQLVNEDDDLIYIPNNFIFANDVINYSKKNKKFTVEFELAHNQIHSIGDLENYLEKIIKPYTRYIKPESVILNVHRINKEFILLKFQFIFFKPSTEIEKEIKQLVNQKILEYLSNSNVINVI
jgi:small-conductance mechanosensitive channel